MENGSKRQRVHTPVPFKPGFLRKAKVWNFTTYSFAEFNLSPTLNMIIGPNGSGKSTLVASICIGLAGNINLIKRKTLKSMIKTGHEKAIIEIEIENFENQPPLIIKREFTAKESTWFLNNKRTTEKEIKELRKRFNIQLDNLCHFLPQERVAEFAGLQSDKLLLETERTLGDGHLLEMHEDLIVKDETSQNLARNIDETTLRLNKLLEEKEKLEQDAKKVEEYESKLDQIKNYKLLVPYAMFYDLKKARASLKKKRDLAKERIKTFEKNYIQLRTDIEEIENESEIEKVGLSENEKKKEKLKNELDKINTKQTHLMLEISQYISQISQYKNKAQQKRKELEETQNELSQLISRKESVEQIDNDEIEKLRKEIGSKRSIQHDIEAKVEQDQNVYKDFTNELRVIRSQIERENNKLNSKDKLDILMSIRTPYKLRDDSFKTHKKLRNEPEIKNRYFEAPVISCEVDDPDAAHGIEKIIDNNTLFALTVTRENQNHLEDVLNKLDSNPPTRTINSLSNPKNSREELERYKFDGYLSDYITGPPEVLTMLYNTNKIDKIPFCRNALSSEQIDQLSDKDFPFLKVVAGDTVHSIKKSLYGARQAVRTTESIPRSQYFLTKGLSEDDKNLINEKINQLNKQGQEKSQELNNFKQKSEDSRIELRKVQTEINELKSKYQNLKRVVDIISEIESKIKLRKEKIARLEVESNKDYTQRIKNYENKIIDTYNSISELSQQSSNLILESSNLEIQIKFKKFDLLNLKNRKLTGNALIRELDTLQENLKNDFKKYAREYNEIKQSEQYKEMERINQEHSQETISLISQLAQEYIDNDTFCENTIRKKVQLLEDELSLLSSADKSSIQNLKTKLEEIQRAETDLPRYKSEKERLDTRITTIRETWENELDGLINQISIAFNHRFTKVASDGRVELGKSDRFKDWKLLIKVKFRESSELKVLDHQSQSGGERAVSTIFFIMSLQGLTDAPFRIVDEINQGMDPKNEQMAHKYLVHTACQNNKSQYFLVTPKLLTGLYYHPDMVIHCIFTGPLIESNNEGRKFLDFVGKLN